MPVQVLITFHSLRLSLANPKMLARGGQYTTRRCSAKGTRTPGMSQGFCQGCTRSREASRDTAESAFSSSTVTNTDGYK